MRCDEIQQMLSAFVDGEETREESVSVRAHLECCEGCRDTVAAYRAIEAMVSIEQDVPAFPRLGRPRLFRPARVLVAAAMLTLAAGGSVLAGVGAFDDGEQGSGVTPVIDVPAPLDVVPSASPRPSESARPTPGPTPTKDPTVQPSERPRPEDRPAAARGTNGELALALMMERTVAEPGERIRTGAVLRNVTDHDVTFDSPEASPIDLVVLDGEGNEVWRRSSTEEWERVLVTRTLAPGEQIAERIRFRAPRPGKYRIYAECICLPEDSPTDPNERPTTKDGPSSKTGPFRTNEIAFASVPERSLDRTSCVEPRPTRRGSRFCRKYPDADGHLRALG